MACSLCTFYRRVNVPRVPRRFDASGMVTLVTNNGLVLTAVVNVRNEEGKDSLAQIL